MLEYLRSILAAGPLLDEELVLAHELISAADLLAKILTHIRLMLLEWQLAAKPIGRWCLRSRLLVLNIYNLVIYLMLHFARESLGPRLYRRPPKGTDILLGWSDFNRHHGREGAVLGLLIGLELILEAHLECQGLICQRELLLDCFID